MFNGEDASATRSCTSSGDIYAQVCRNRILSVVGSVGQQERKETQRLVSMSPNTRWHQRRNYLRMMSLNSTFQP